MDPSRNTHALYPASQPVGQFCAGGCGVAGTSSAFAGVRSLGDAEQQADH